MHIRMDDPSSGPRTFDGGVVKTYLNVLDYDYRSEIGIFVIRIILPILGIKFFSGHFWSSAE